MKKSIAIVGAVLSLCFVAAAQDTPVADWFLGYSLFRANSAQSIPAFTANGGLTTGAYNLNDHIGVEAEFGGYHNGNVNNHQFDSTNYTFLFGPRLSYGRSKKVDPYIHTLFGVTHLSTSISQAEVLASNPSVVATPNCGSRYCASQANFAMAIGGGLDIKVTKSVILRPIQLDYLLTRFQAPNFLTPTGTTSNRNQNNLRYAAGVAFNFGAR